MQLKPACSLSGQGRRKRLRKKCTRKKKNKGLCLSRSARRFQKVRRINRNLSNAHKAKGKRRDRNKKRKHNIRKGRLINFEAKIDVNVGGGLGGDLTNIRQNYDNKQNPSSVYKHNQESSSSSSSSNSWYKSFKQSSHQTSHTFDRQPELIFEAPWPVGPKQGVGQNNNVKGGGNIDINGNPSLTGNGGGLMGMIGLHLNQYGGEYGQMTGHGEGGTNMLTGLKGKQA